MDTSTEAISEDESDDDGVDTRWNIVHDSVTSRSVLHPIVRSLATRSPFHPRIDIMLGFLFPWCPIKHDYPSGSQRVLAIFGDVVHSLLLLP